MADFTPTESEETVRAAASRDINPATPAGFLRLFDALAFNRLVAVSMLRAKDRRKGLHVLRKQDQQTMASYFQVAMACASELEGKAMSFDEIAMAITGKVQELDLRRWFKVEFTNQQPEAFATHFFKYHHVRSGAPEAVELLPDNFVPADDVVRASEMFDLEGADMCGEFEPPGQVVH